MSFIVIEGDNGTGKDTLAQKIQKDYGYKILTYEPEIKQIEKYAKESYGKEKIKRFLEYGRASSEMALKYKNNILLVRYWISTLAAAYADEVYNFEDICEIIDDISESYFKPDIVFCLWCDFDNRIERIKNRNSSDFDDTTKNRSLRYKWILQQIEKRSDLNWINIDTTRKSLEDVYEEISEFLK